MNAALASDDSDTRQQPAPDRMLRVEEDRSDPYGTRQADAPEEYAKTCAELTSRMVLITRPANGAGARGKGPLPPHRRAEKRYRDGG